MSVTGPPTHMSRAHDAHSSAEHASASPAKAPRLVTTNAPVKRPSVAGRRTLTAPVPVSRALYTFMGVVTAAAEATISPL